MIFVSVIMVITSEASGSSYWWPCGKPRQLIIEHKTSAYLNSFRFTWLPSNVIHNTRVLKGAYLYTMNFVYINFGEVFYFDFERVLFLLAQWSH